MEDEGFNMTDFEKGVEFAFKYIKDNMIGRVVNGQLEAVVTKKDLERLQKTIPKKCNSCDAPCGQSWCSTITDK